MSDVDAPPVTVRDPREPRLRFEAVEPEPADAGSRTPVLVLVVAAVLLAGAGLVGEAHERRAETVAEQTRQGLVAVATTERYASGLDTDAVDDGKRARLSLPLGLRNLGPYDVVVEQARLGGLHLRAPVSLPRRDDLRLELEQPVNCATRPADMAGDLRRVQLRLRTADGTRTELDVPAPSGVDPGQLRRAAATACGYLPIEQAFYFQLEVPRLEGARVEADLIAIGAGRAPLRITALGPGPGLAVRLLDGAGALPVQVDPRQPSGRPSVRALRVALSVVDCAALPRELDRDEDSPPVLRVTVTDPGGRTATVAASPADGLRVLQLLDGGC